jgi:hypothetical protein
MSALPLKNSWYRFSLVVMDGGRRIQMQKAGFQIASTTARTLQRRIMEEDCGSQSDERILEA